LSNISVNDDFKFPAVNEFIPSKLDVEKFQVEEKTKKPELIQDTPVTRIWYKKDDTFWVPRTNMWVLFKNPLLATTPRNGAMSQ
jgi:insulysin